MIKEDEGGNGGKTKIMERRREKMNYKRGEKDKHLNRKAADPTDGVFVL